jgi:dihydrolipoamide dehydrogenase
VFVLSYDLIVVGGGPGGYVAAIRASQLGAKVALVEKDSVGGTCLNRGCIPTKALIASTSVLENIKRAADFGLSVENYKIDFSKIMERKNAVVQQMLTGVNYLIKKNKIDLVAGTAKVLSNNKVEVTKEDGSIENIEGKHIVLATGSEPALISALGYNGKTVITSDEILNIESIPESLLIIGGGVIGCEFAIIFAGLGSKVTIVEAMPSILPMEDTELTRRFTLLLKKRGITVKTKAMIETVKEGPDGVEARLENGDVFKAEKVLISIGRTFNTKGLGLEEVGLELGPKGEILVNDYLETNIPGIYAIGDVTNKIQLAHVASAQGILLVENLFGGKKEKMDYSAVPSCIFTSPEIASVGITQEQAKEQGIEVNIGKFSFMACGKAVCIGETDGMVKFIADKATDKILGVHILGPHATDLIAEATLAINMGITSEQLAKTIHAHPTLAETLMEAAEGVHGKTIHA